MHACILRFGQASLCLAGPALQREDQAKVHVEVVSAEGTLSVWVGLSIIGSLSSNVHEKPVIEVLSFCPKPPLPR